MRLFRCFIVREHGCVEQGSGFDMEPVRGGLSWRADPVHSHHHRLHYTDGDADGLRAHPVAHPTVALRTGRRSAVRNKKDQTFPFTLCVSFSVMRISSKGVTRDRVLRLTRIVGFFNSNMSWLIAMALAKLAQSVISTANVRARAPLCAAFVDRSI